MCYVCKNPGHKFGSIDCPAHLTRNSTDVVPFQGQHDCFSNFYPTKLKVFGYTFGSSEVAYQWKKAQELGYTELGERIFNSRHAGESKRLAKEIDTSESATWGEKRLQIMMEILEAKLIYCQRYRSELLESGRKIIAEATNDKFWGTGLWRDQTFRTMMEYWPGINKLGEMHMNIRKRLRQGEFDKLISETQDEVDSFTGYSQNLYKASNNAECFNSTEQESVNVNNQQNSFNPKYNRNINMARRAVGNANKWWDAAENNTKLYTEWSDSPDSVSMTTSSQPGNTIDESADDDTCWDAEELANKVGSQVDKGADSTSVKSKQYKVNNNTGHSRENSYFNAVTKTVKSCIKSMPDIDIGGVINELSDKNVQQSMKSSEGKAKMNSVRSYRDNSDFKSKGRSNEQSKVGYPRSTTSDSSDISTEHYERGGRYRGNRNKTSRNKKTNHNTFSQVNTDSNRSTDKHSDDNSRSNSENLIRDATSRNDLHIPSSKERLTSADKFDDNVPPMFKNQKRQKKPKWNYLYGINDTYHRPRPGFSDQSKSNSSPSSGSAYDDTGNFVYNNSKHTQHSNNVSDISDIKGRHGTDRNCDAKTDANLCRNSRINTNSDTVVGNSVHKPDPGKDTTDDNTSVKSSWSNYQPPSPTRVDDQYSNADTGGIDVSFCSTDALNSENLYVPPTPPKGVAEEDNFDKLHDTSINMMSSPSVHNKSVESNTSIYLPPSPQQQVADEYNSPCNSPSLPQSPSMADNNKSDSSYLPPSPPKGVAEGDNSDEISNIACSLPPSPGTFSHTDDINCDSNTSLYLPPSPPKGEEQAECCENKQEESPNSYRVVDSDNSESECDYEELMKTFKAHNVSQDSIDTSGFCTSTTTYHNEDYNAESSGNITYQDQMHVSVQRGDYDPGDECISVSDVDEAANRTTWPLDYDEDVHENPIQSNNDMGVVSQEQLESITEESEKESNNQILCSDSILDSRNFQMNIKSNSSPNLSVSTRTTTDEDRSQSDSEYELCREELTETDKRSSPSSKMLLIQSPRRLPPGITKLPDPNVHKCVNRPPGFPETSDHSKELGNLIKTPPGFKNIVLPCLTVTDQTPVPPGFKTVSMVNVNERVREILTEADGDTD